MCFEFKDLMDCLNDVMEGLEGEDAKYQTMGMIVIDPVTPFISLLNAEKTKETSEMILKFGLLLKGVLWKHDLCGIVRLVYHCFFIDE